MSNTHHVPLTCPAPSCDFEIGELGKVETFVDVGDHADEDHGDEVEFVREEHGWVLRCAGDEVVL